MFGISGFGVLLLGYLVVMNMVGFSLMFIDKKRAGNNQWRIKEATLFLVAAIGGSVGSLLGMKIFRHKTKHLSFLIGMPLILILQIGIVVAGYVFFIQQ